MFQHVRELMEREAAAKSSYIIKRVEYSRNLNMIYHMIYLLAGIIGFCVIFVSYVITEKLGIASNIVIWSGIILGFISVVGLNILRDDYARLNATYFKFNKLKNQIKERLYKDFLTIPLWLSVVLLWLPLYLTFILMVYKSSGWISLESVANTGIKENLKYMMTFAGVLLGAQLALFTFITGSLVGRYSGNLAKTVIFHRAYCSLMLFSIFEMGLLFYGLMFGLPDGFIHLPNVLGVLTLICMVLSIWVTIESIVSERAIVYTGFHFSKRINRSMKKAVVLSDKPSRFWNILSALAFDWRSTDRFSYLKPPQKYLNAVSIYLNALFNAANRAIREGEQEIFRAALSGVLQVMTAYTQKRASYYGSDDEVFSFLNNQMGAIMHSTSKISNEYLITDAIRYSGLFGKLTLDIGSADKLKAGDEIQRKMPKGHPMALYWIGQLKEGFNVSHSLMRCTGASEAQEQLLGIATKALKKGYDEVIKFNYIPAANDIHIVCLQNYDAYHRTLAGNCYKHLLLLLLFSLIDVECKERHFYVEKEIIEAIGKMVKLRHIIKDMPALDFSDAINVLVSKVSSERATLQDIVLHLSRIQWKEKWEYSACANEISRIINLIKNIAVDAIKTNQAMTVGYIEALYEIGYIVLCEETKIPYEHRECCEKEIFVAWREIINLCLDKNNHHIFQWEQPVFSLIGYGLLVLEKRSNNDEKLKKELIESIKLYFDFVKKEHNDPKTRVSDSVWAYLRLLGAWTSFFIKEENLGKEILDFIANYKPYVYSTSFFGGSSTRSKYGHLGYPTLMYGDFFMPWLRNIQKYLNENELKNFEELQARLMGEEVLYPPYEDIEKIRSPRRNKFYEEMRKKRSKLHEG